MLGLGKKGLKEGDFVFARQPDGEYNKIIFGAVTGVQGKKIGVNGIIINPVGLKNKIEQGKAGPRSIEILKNPNPDNCIQMLIYRIEHDNFNEIIDLEPALPCSILFFSPTGLIIIPLTPIFVP